MLDNQVVQFKGKRNGIWYTSPKVLLNIVRNGNNESIARFGVYYDWCVYVDINMRYQNVDTSTGTSAGIDQGDTIIWVGLNNGRATLERLVPTFGAGAFYEGFFKEGD